MKECGPNVSSSRSSQLLCCWTISLVCCRRIMIAPIGRRWTDDSRSREICGSVELVTRDRCCASTYVRTVCTCVIARVSLASSHDDGDTRMIWQGCQQPTVGFMWMRIVGTNERKIPSLRRLLLLLYTSTELARKPPLPSSLTKAPATIDIAIEDRHHSSKNENGQRTFRTIGRIGGTTRNVTYHGIRSR